MTDTIIGSRLIPTSVEFSSLIPHRLEPKLSTEGFPCIQSDALLMWNWAQNRVKWEERQGVRFLFWGASKQRPRRCKPPDSWVPGLPGAQGAASPSQAKKGNLGPESFGPSIVAPPVSPMTFMLPNTFLLVEASLDWFLSSITKL